MSEKGLFRLDLASATLLLLWVGMALGFAFLTAPIAFQVLPSRDLAARVVGVALRRLDLLAWIAFGLPLALSFGSRWLAEFQEEGVGPLRLWSATLLVALLMTFASAAIVNPKIARLRASFGMPIEQVPADHPDRPAFAKAHSVSRQLLALRVLLALGLAGGLIILPRRKVEA